jgi:hypothetical protein
MPVTARLIRAPTSLTDAEVKVSTARFSSFDCSFSLKFRISHRKYTHSDLPQNRIITPDLAAH